MKVVRVHTHDRAQRTWPERALMLSPPAFLALLGPVFRLPPGNRLRTAVLRSLVERTYAALNRQDFEVVKAGFRPDAALNFGSDIALDYERRYEGRDLAFDVYRRWLGEWGSVRRVPVGFVDRGDTLVVLARERLRGESSGLEVDRELGTVSRLRGPAVAEQWEFLSWDEALSL